MNTMSLKRLLCQVSVLCSLIVLLSACAGGSANQGKTTTTLTTAASSAQGPGAAASPGIGLGPQACPTAVKDAAYWDARIPTQAGVSKVENVTCGYLKGAPTLQALVTVRYSGTGSVMDIYVYDDITGATPKQMFKLQNLYMGAAKISVYNSVITAEVDMASSANKDKGHATYAADLFREFKWSDGAGTLVPVAFPGIFPDLTRYQADDDQAQVNQGHQPWKLSATMTAQAFGANLLRWDPNTPATLVSGGGSHDVQAVVSLKTTGPASNSITLSLTRLEGNTNGGIWIVTEAVSQDLTITQPQSGSIIRSPTTVTGTGDAFEGVIGQVAILDHLYTDIGHAQAKGASGNGHTTFSTTVTSHPTFKNGTEEGLVILTAPNNANGSIAGVAIVKVLIL